MSTKKTKLAAAIEAKGKHGASPTLEPAAAAVPATETTAAAAAAANPVAAPAVDDRWYLAAAWTQQLLEMWWCGALRPAWCPQRGGDCYCWEDESMRGLVFRMPSDPSAPVEGGIREKVRAIRHCIECGLRCGTVEVEAAHRGKISRILEAIDSLELWELDDPADAFLPWIGNAVTRTFHAPGSAGDRSFLVIDD